jgi:hypothetical protein
MTTLETATRMENTIKQRVHAAMAARFMESSKFIGCGGYGTFRA